MKTVLRKSTVGSLPKAVRPCLVLTLLTLSLATLHAQIPSLVFTQRWALGPGSRYDIPAAADSFTRGVALNKLTGNILLASRTSSNHIAVLSGSTGAELGTISNSFTSGTLALIHVRVADDGVIYACNLYGGAGSIFKIYRWDSEAQAIAGAPPVLAFNAGPVVATTQRYGDAMDIRGAGTNTQMVVSGSASTVFAVFTTTDGTNFTATEFTHGLGAGELGKGITFEGTNNVIYGKKDGSVTLHRVGFDIPTVTSTLLTNITLTTPDVGTKYLEGNGVKFVIGCLNANNATASSHKFKAYVINNPASPTVAADVTYPGPYLADGNVLGANDGSATVAVTEQSNNGLMVFDIGYVTNLPPAIVSQPSDQTNILAGGYVTFSVGASGTDPKTYRWKFNDTTDVPGGTNSILNLTNVSAANAGFYKCAVTNATGFAISTNATLAVIPSVLSSAAQPLWSKSVNDLFFLANDNTTRGLGYNPVTGHLIVVSRTPSNGVHVVNAATGAYISSLDMSAIIAAGTIGTFNINLGGVGDDGAIYVANLDTAGVNYIIWRWADENPATVAAVAFGPGSPGPADRFGDTFAVRGAGTNTQILTTARNLTAVVLFTTTDGLGFTPTTIDVSTEPAGFAGLGIAFGAGDTFWSKSSGYQFRHIAFDLVNATNGLLQTFAAGQSTACILGVDPVNDLVAGIVPNTGTRPLPDHLELYDVHEVLSGAAANATLIDQDFFQTANVNGNGTGAAAFDVAGGRLFALDTNNGLLALKVVARLKHAGNVLSWAGPSTLQGSTNVVGTYLDIPAAPSPHTKGASEGPFFRLKR